MAVQPGLCGTRSKYPKTGFLTTRLICTCFRNENGVKKTVASEKMRKIVAHRIDGNPEGKFFNKFSFSIAKNNIFDCQNQYYRNRKHPICVQQLPLWQSKTSNLPSAIAILAIENSLFGNHEQFTFQ